MEPGTITKEFTLTSGETTVFDTRYNYKIKKSDFIDYCKSCIYETDPYYAGIRIYENYSVDGLWDNVTDLNQIDWDNIENFSFYIGEVGYSLDYVRDTNLNYGCHGLVNATVEGEYLVFDFYSVVPDFFGATCIFITDIVNDIYIYRNMTHKLCSYDVEDNRLALHIYEGSDSRSELTNINATDDVEYKYVNEFETGYEITPSDITIYEPATEYHTIKIVNINDTSMDLTDECNFNYGVGHTGTTSAAANYFVRFDDTYPTYTYLSTEETTDEYGIPWKVLVFGVDKHIHSYGNPIFTWNEDYSECIATFNCIGNDDTQTLNCTVTNTKVNANCTENGKITYIAKIEFNGNTYTDTKEITIAKLGHKFGEWYEVKAATIDEEGIIQRDCIRNDLSEKKAITKLTKTAVVNGYLKDKDGKPIANKKVELHSEPKYAYTDENGYFEFKDVELGEHTLKVFNTNNTLICELSLVLDKTESSVDEEWVDKGFKWDKTIVVSNVSLEIDGLKVNDTTEKPTEPITEKPTEKPTEESTEQPTEESTEQPTEPITEETTTEQPTKPVIPPTTEELTTEELVIEEEITKEPIQEKNRSNITMIGCGLFTFLLLGCLIFAFCKQRKTIAYTYTFIIKDGEYSNKTVVKANIEISLKAMENNKEIKFNKAPILKNKENISYSDILNVLYNNEKGVVIKKNEAIENEYCKYYGWDKVDYNVIAYSLEFANNSETDNLDYEVITKEEFNDFLNKNANVISNTEALATDITLL